MSDDEPFDTRIEAFVPRVILGLVNALDPTKSTGEMYVKWMSLINYAIVAGIGVIINQLILHRMVSYMALWLANLIAIFVAFGWNYLFSVGPLGYLFGLSLKPRKLENE